MLVTADEVIRCGVVAHVKTLKARYAGRRLQRHHARSDSPTATAATKTTRATASAVTIKTRDERAGGGDDARAKPSAGVRHRAHGRISLSGVRQRVDRSRHAG